MPTLLRVGFWFALVALTVASLVPVAMLPPQALSLWDKAQHALGFAALAGAAFAAYPRYLARAAVALLLWGGVIELLQYASGWRQGDWLDWLADVLGIALAGLIWRLIHKARTAHP